MARIAQVIADSCSKALSDLAHRSGALTLETLNYKSSLKYSICVDNRIAIDIIDDSSFEVYQVEFDEPVVNGTVIPEARLADFFLGSARVLRQYDTVLGLRESKNSAWLLVSAYYSAFFACIELTKMFGRISFSVDGKDMYDIRVKSTGASHSLFFSRGHSNFVGTERAGRLVFHAIGAKPHAFAWDNAKHVARSIFQGRAWNDANNFIAMLENPECAPSQIRNTWNYKRADYFGSLGDAQAVEFRKLLGNLNGAEAWISQRGGNPGSLEPCVVAVMAETLSSAVVMASKRAKQMVRVIATS